MLRFESRRYNFKIRISDDITAENLTLLSNPDSSRVYRNMTRWTECNGFMGRAYKALPHLQPTVTRMSFTRADTKLKRITKSKTLRIPPTRRDSDVVVSFYYSALKAIHLFSKVVYSDDMSERR